MFNGNLFRRTSQVFGHRVRTPPPRRDSVVVVLTRLWTVHTHLSQATLNYRNAVCSWTCFDYCSPPRAHFLRPQGQNPLKEEVLGRTAERNGGSGSNPTSRDPTQGFRGPLRDSAGSRCMYVRTDGHLPHFGELGRVPGRNRDMGAPTTRDLVTRWLFTLPRNFLLVREWTDPLPTRSGYRPLLVPIPSS